MKKTGIAILGLGEVGGEAYRILSQNAGYYKKSQELDVSVESVLGCKERAAALGIPAEKMAGNIAEVVSDPDVQIVAECLGDPETAREYVLAALNAGKTVVSSNKELIAKYSGELERAAKRQNAGLYFGAGYLGGVPVVRTLLNGLQADKVTSLTGILNGPSNYILTKMADGMSYAAALGEAKQLGYAGEDPSADVEGCDAAYKLAVLASIAFRAKISAANVFREGISSLKEEDVRLANELGYLPKLLAVGRCSENGIEVRVHPALVEKTHPLAPVSGMFNAVLLHGDALGDVMLYGLGAGAGPMGSAVVSDILYAASHPEAKPAFRYVCAEKDLKFAGDFSGAYYLRIAADDEAGVLSKIASVFAKCNISIREICPRSGAEGKAVIVITYETHEEAVRSAVAKLNAGGFASVQTVLRAVLR